LTGIQALVRAHPTKPPRWKKSNGKNLNTFGTALKAIANWQLSDGCPPPLLPLAAKQTLRHIAKTVETDAQAGWILS